jgi:hypothetical protein
MRSARVAVGLDVCCVLLFVVIGRASHTQGETLAGIAATSWPFLCGLAAGWAASRAWRRPLALRPAGLAVWLCTVAVGMILRVVSGQGTAVAFIFVALAFLGLFLLGWRVVGRLLTARASASARLLRGGEDRGREAAGRGLWAARVESVGHVGHLGEFVAAEHLD